MFSFICNKTMNFVFPSSQHTFFKTVLCSCLNVNTVGVGQRKKRSVRVLN
uniref:Uncharacterized protein n=1 Tax=Gasterosteus aculeatus aculeatus TaxID=481459 RepID=A0AAQ4QQI3_GASAC